MTKELCAMLGLMPLPATLRCGGTPLSVIRRQAVSDAKAMYAAGIRNIMVQNIGDLPLLQTVGLETVANMTMLCTAVRDALPNDCKLGVSVLMNDGPASLAIAEAVSADYIRAKIYVGAMVAAGGIECGCMDAVLTLKQRLCSKVQIYADVHDRTGTPLGNVSLLEACEQALTKGLSDVLIITGKDHAESLAMIDEVKGAFPLTPVYLGGGAKPDNLCESLRRCDGVIVGSFLKTEGCIDHPLDPERMQRFMTAWNGLVSLA